MATAKAEIPLEDVSNHPPTQDIDVDEDVDVDGEDIAGEGVDGDGKKKSKKKKRSKSKDRLDKLEQGVEESEELERSKSSHGKMERRKSKEKLERRASKEKLERAESKGKLEKRASKAELDARQAALETKDEEIEAIIAREEEEMAKLQKERELAEKAKKEKEAEEKEKGKGKGKGKGKKADDDLEKGEKKSTEEEERKIGYFELFRFANSFDYLLMFLGILAAMGHGVLMPLFSIFFGDVIDGFGPTATASSLTDIINGICVKFLILAGVAAVTSFLQVALLSYSGQRQAKKLRFAYLRALFSQDIGWYDVNETGVLTSHISGDIVLIQDAISEKIGTLVQSLTMFIAGFAVGFSESWRLTLVILSVVPLLMICGAMMGYFVSQLTNSSQSAYGNSGGIAEEVISAIRTVAAFGGENLEKARYAKALEESLKAGIKKNVALGLGIGVTMFVMFSAYSLAFFYGNELINQGLISGGKVITVFFGVVIGAMALGQSSPALSAFGSGMGAATKIYHVIERTSKIDAWSDVGFKPEKCTGEVEFRDVQFTYPSRPNQPILNGMSFTLKPGQTMAFVGSSGCGKSTSIALLERFYDPTSGSIFVDGIDIKQLSVQWLRSKIGLVGQEPVLFNKTIAENIAFGRDGVTQEEIEKACQMSNAHEFITKLPQGYQTMVGERGTQLSGGQKQRIAIARALVRDPRILLLDEATSALDNNSEKIVQDALDKARAGRSTIVIAHRLSTIRDADIICVVEQGKITERGTHDELMSKKEKSLYQDLVRLQEIAGKEEESPEEKSKEKSKSKTAAKDDKLKAAKITERTPTAPKDEEEARPLEKEEEEALKRGVVLRSFKLNLPELPLMVVGAFGAICNGAVFPIFALLFGEVLSALLIPDEAIRTPEVHKWCLIFLGLAIGTGLANLFQNMMFGISGERLTNRLRNMLFGSVIRQDIGWFDDDKNGTGILSTKLSTDATLVKGMTGDRVGMSLQLISTMAIGLIIAFTACWKLALVVLACVPVVGAGSAMQLKLLTGFNSKSKKAYEQSGQVATEAITNMRTVISLGIHNKFFGFYAEALRAPDRAAKRIAVISGLGFGFGEAVLFLIWALAFYYGAQLAANGECSFANMMKAITSVIFSAAMGGQLTSMIPDFGKAKAAAASLYAIVDRVPPIDSSSPEGTTLEKVEGTIEFKNVHFNYPTRPDAKILKGLSFTLKPGQTLALVGPSGCGKSTSISLLERFYSPSSGQVLVDGIDIRSLNLRWLRRQIGLVGQEPILFATSIKENIAYGKDGVATEEEVLQASKNANAHKFISTLADGYNTDVGEKGSQLSGGQKQRVAIARALIRDPKILLLDEATSALDSESEKIVQHALNKARKGRTTIVIAHRLSTIQNADQIAVVDNGVVVEQGTHFELLENRGLYYRLVNKKLEGA